MAGKIILLGLNEKVGVANCFRDMCHLSDGGEVVRDAENFGDEANLGQEAEGRTILRLRGLLDNARSGEDQGSFRPRWRRRH